MNTAKEHYDQQIASVYSWMAGAPETVLKLNHDLFCQLGLDSTPRGLAIDLGAGSGFQSIPLAELGFSVVAVDFCAALLSELSARAKYLPVRTVHDDILNFSKHVEEQAQVIVCMGDTLTHLESLSSVQSLLLNVKRALVKDGKLILTFRDYASTELSGTQRFIPVRSDESTILTCFLEYHEDFVEVYDLLYRKDGEQWILNVSSYPKLRINKNWIFDQLQKEGFQVVRNETINGMICVAAQKI
ncbi:methyltransferase domain-containing protein [Nodosilinea sp. FACHB-131]|uniref:class I SAM-dependent methyltransferase n=1 Tax=Cyanophyceae TaxID=3028117 RepID=UPI0016863957|nr:class I SAM-dependent methyltransferase [Nodosilinea sp. FACHB-131]MBD1874879.1 methyltransferase domain-containing protein [Nodosilinea sp. FACHB-131]